MEIKLIGYRHKALPDINDIPWEFNTVQYMKNNRIRTHRKREGSQRVVQLRHFMHKFS